MKVGIITYHFPYNCGAVLQCAALQTKLEQLGQQAGVINYRPWYHQNRYVALKNPIYYGRKQFCSQGNQDTTKKRLSRGIDGFLRSVYSWRNYKKIAPRDKKFRSFIVKQLHQTRTYRTLKQLCDNPPNFDLYISGSDQLWNARITEGSLDPAYFLCFGGEKVVRASYSVGANFDGLQESKMKLKTLIPRFDALSLRETKCLDVIQAAARPGVEVHINLDPTFLLEAEDYEPMMPLNPLEDGPFILTYTMPNESQFKVYNAAKILGEHMGIKVIDVSGNPSKANTKISDNRVCGPDEFLWYVKHASYVLTNSFHGTAFSVIFRKQFAVVPHTDTGNRVSELLEKLGLLSRCARTGQEAAKIVETPIMYQSAEVQLSVLRDESIDYIKSCINLTADRLG